MKKPVSIVLALSMLLVTLTVVSAQVTTSEVEIRGEVSQLNSARNFSINTWDSTNFAGFWYDIDENRQTENLDILQFKDNRSIDKDNLKYVTTRAAQKYKVFKEKGSNFTVEHGLDANLNKPSSPSRGGYYALVGWMAEKYVGVNGKNNKLSRLILEQDATDKKTLQVGETWDLGEGYTLTAQSIDAKATPRQAWLVLSKDGVKLDDKVSAQGDTYTYSTGLSGETDVPVFVTYIDSVFAGQTSDMVQLKYTWVISSKVTEIKSGDKYGIFEVDTEQPLALSNSASLSLTRDSTVSLAGNMKFKVADSEDNDVRFYPFVEITTPGKIEVRGTVSQLKTVTPTPTATGSATPTPTPTGNATPSPTATGNATPTPTATGNATPTPTGNATPKPTATGNATPKPTLNAVTQIAGTNFSVKEWNARNFAGFWYDIDDNKETEKLSILAFKDTRSIDQDNLVYETGRASQKYKAFSEKGNKVENGLDANLNKPTSPSEGGYYALVGWMAEKYIAVNGKNNKLSRLIMEQDATDKQTLQVGQTWEIGEGYTLSTQSIDAKATPRQAWLVLSKDGVKLDDKVVEQNEVYTYSLKNLAGESDVPVFVTYVDSVFAGQTSDMVQLKYTWVISDKVTEVKSGDKFGIFEVDTEQPLILKNSASLSLTRDSTVNLAGNMKFKVADSEDNDVRFYPKIDYQIGNETNATKPTTVTTVIGNQTPIVTKTVVGNQTPIVTKTVATPQTTQTAKEVKPTTTKGTPGFESIFAIVGLLAVAYLVLRQRRD